MSGQTSSRAECGSRFWTVNTWYFKKLCDAASLIGRDSKDLQLDVRRIRRRRGNTEMHMSPKLFWGFSWVDSIYPKMANKIMWYIGTVLSRTSLMGKSCPIHERMPTLPSFLHFLISFTLSSIIHKHFPHPITESKSSYNLLMKVRGSTRSLGLLTIKAEAEEA